MNKNYNNVINTLEENHQDQVLKLFNSLDDTKKEKLANQILTINFKQLNDLYQKTNKKPEILNQKLEHIKYVDEYKLNEKDKQKYTS